MSEEKFVDVRVAVVVASDGQWVAYGDDEAGDTASVLSPQDTLNEAEAPPLRQTTFLTARLPVPQPPSPAEVEAQAEEVPGE